MKCPNCDAESMKVIYYGLPARLCRSDECRRLFGFWSFILERLPFNGRFLGYTGSYLPALWTWLRRAP